MAATLGLLPWLGNSMFADEGATLYSAHLSWLALWAQSLHVDLVMLPYYVVVHFWLILSGSPGIGIVHCRFSHTSEPSWRLAGLACALRDDGAASSPQF